MWCHSQTQATHNYCQNLYHNWTRKLNPWNKSTQNLSMTISKNATKICPSKRAKRRVMPPKFARLKELLVFTLIHLEWEGQQTTWIKQRAGANKGEAPKTTMSKKKHNPKHFHDNLLIIMYVHDTNILLTMVIDYVHWKEIIDQQNWWVWPSSA